MENKDESEVDVKDVDTSYVEPSTDEEEAELESEEETETPPLSSDGENEEEQETEEEAPAEEEVTPDPIVEETGKLENETPREYALRKELEKTRKQLRKEKEDELFVKDSKPKRNEDDVLSEYDPEEVQKLEKIIGKLGYVKKGEIESQTYDSIANEELTKFIDSHPEYSPENDKDGVVWNQFKAEFQLYKKPESPREYKKIFERVHSVLHGSPTVDIKKINASKEKLKVASHNGAANQIKTVVKKPVTQGLRTDMLKGFDDDEINDLIS